MTEFRDDELPGMPGPTATPFEDVVQRTRAALTVVREGIDKRVQMRTEINGEIKQLRADEDRLSRMLKVAESEVRKEYQA